MKKRGVLLALLLIAAAPAHAQRAVTFNGITTLFNNGGITLNHASSDEGVISYWYNSTFPKSASIFAVTPGSQNNYMAVKVEHRYHPVDGTMRLGLTLAAPPTVGAGFMRLVGDMPLPYDGQWHHISLTWNTNLLNAIWALDCCDPHHWDQSVSVSTTSSFTVQYAGVQGSPDRWFVAGAPNAAYLPVVQNLGGGSYNIYMAPLWQKFAGKMAEAFMLEGNGIYNNILNPVRDGVGFAIDEFGLGFAEPLELGPNGIGVFGPAFGQPELLLQGAAQFFPVNGGGARTFTVQGVLTTSSDDPFTSWTP